MRLVRLKKTTERKAWGCPRTKNRSNWCHAWCIPRHGIGDCGRLAAHGMLGKTQQAILDHKNALDDFPPPRLKSVPPAPRPSRRKRRRLQVIELLRARDLEGLLALAGKESTLPSTLVACLSELDDVLRWRVIEALGLVAEELAKKDPDKVADLVRRLFWSMTEECGGTAWHAPEAIGEILARVPELAPDFTSVLASHANIEPFEEGVLWSLRRLASSRPDLVREEAEVLLAATHSPLPGKRGHAAATLWAMRLPGGEEALTRLGADTAEVVEYDRRAGVMTRTTVAHNTREPRAISNEWIASSDRQRKTG